MSWWKSIFGAGSAGPKLIVRMKPKRVRLFIKSYCPWCHKAEDWLEDHGIDYETLDVISDSKAYEEMVTLSGQDLAPVIDIDGRILADFGPSDLARFWRKLELEEEPAP